MFIYTVPTCTSPAGLGVEDGSILDSQITLSSGTGSGRLNSMTNWVADGADATPYVEVFLGGRATVFEVVIQGNGQTGAAFVWVRTFEIQYSQDNGNTWLEVKDAPTTASPSAEVRNYYKQL